MKMSNPRERDAHKPKQNELVGLPYRPFLFTVDQIAGLVSMSEQTLKARYMYFEGRSTGSRSSHLMVARNIAHPNDKPDWRVTERELIRWMKLKGFKNYEGTVAIY